MHNHQWVVVETRPADPRCIDSVNLAKKYTMTAICRDPACREKRIYIPEFEIHPTGSMTDPVQKVPKAWETMTVKATDEELEAIAGFPVQEYLN